MLNDDSLESLPKLNASILTLAVSNQSVGNVLADYTVTIKFFNKRKLHLSKQIVEIQYNWFQSRNICQGKCTHGKVTHWKLVMSQSKLLNKLKPNNLIVYLHLTNRMKQWRNVWLREHLHSLLLAELPDCIHYFGSLFCQRYLSGLLKSFQAWNYKLGWIILHKVLRFKQTSQLVRVQIIHFQIVKVLFRISDVKHDCKFFQQLFINLLFSVWLFYFKF